MDFEFLNNPFILMALASAVIILSLVLWFMYKSVPRELFDSVLGFLETQAKQTETKDDDAIIAWLRDALKELPKHEVIEIDDETTDITPPVG